MDGALKVRKVISVGYTPFSAEEEAMFAYQVETFHNSLLAMPRDRGLVSFHDRYLEELLDNCGRAYATIEGLRKEIGGARVLLAREVDHTVRLMKQLDRASEGWRRFRNALARVQHLEEMLRRRREVITQLEACRTFEQQTQGLLVEFIKLVARGDYDTKGEQSDARNDALEIVKLYEKRMGPRSSNDSHT